MFSRIIPIVAETGAYEYVPMTRKHPILEAEKVVVQAFRTFAQSDDIDALMPVLLLSDDAGWSYANSMVPDSGTENTNVTEDIWQSTNGPWQWDIDWNDPTLRDKTHFKVGIRVKATGGDIAFFRAQINYQIKPRRVKRVPSVQRVIACTTDAHWRTTRAVVPHVPTGHMRVTYEVANLYKTGGTSIEVYPIWWYNDAPGDEGGWTKGGDLLGTGQTTAGQFTTDGIEVTALTDHALVSFGWTLKLTGGSGDTGLAHVAGTFALY